MLLGKPLQSLFLTPSGPWLIAGQVKEELLRLKKLATAFPGPCGEFPWYIHEIIVRGSSLLASSHCSLTIGLGNAHVLGDVSVGPGLSIAWRFECLQ